MTKDTGGKFTPTDDLHGVGFDHILNLLGISTLLEISKYTRNGFYEEVATRWRKNKKLRQIHGSPGFESWGYWLDNVMMEAGLEFRLPPGVIRIPPMLHCPHCNGLLTVKLEEVK